MIPDTRNDLNAMSRQIAARGPPVRWRGLAGVSVAYRWRRVWGFLWPS